MHWVMHYITNLNEKRFFNIPGALLALLLVLAIDAEVPPGIELCKKAELLLVENALDSAFVTFYAAYRSGMPKDSLYYFWGQIYIAQNSPDSALSLNYAINPIDSGFSRQVLSQRAQIFEMLGIGLEPQRKDSPQKDESSWMLPKRGPVFQVVASGGVSHGTQLPDSTIPWKYFNQEEKLEEAGYQVSSTFRYPLSRWQFRGIGVRAHIVKPYSYDILSHKGSRASVSAFAAMSFLQEKVMLEYEPSLSNTREENWSHNHNVLVATVPKKVPIHFAGLSYQVRFSMDGKIENQAAWALVNLQHTISSAQSVHGSLFGMYMKTDPLNVPIGIARLLYSDDISSRLPFFYSDRSCSELVVDTSNKMTWVENAFLNSAKDSVFLRTFMPQEKISVTPQLTYTTKILPILELSAIVSGSCEYYLGNAHWSTMEEDQFVQARYIVYNKLDGKYYYYSKLPRVVGGQRLSESASGPIVFRDYERKRIDGSVGVGASISVQVRYVGKITVRVDNKWHYSTLRGNILADIRDRNLTLSGSVQTTFPMIKNEKY